MMSLTFALFLKGLFMDIWLEIKHPWASNIDYNQYFWSKTIDFDKIGLLWLFWKVPLW
jgi:hypothetical protein